MLSGLIKYSSAFDETLLLHTNYQRFSSVLIISRIKTKHGVMTYSAIVFCTPDFKSLQEEKE